MKTLKNLIKSPHIQLSFVTGLSIIVLAWFSKRVLPEPLSYLEHAGPPFVMVIYEAVQNKNKDSKWLKTWYWVSAIIVSTAGVILYNMYL